MNTDKANSLGLLLYGFSNTEVCFLREHIKNFNESEILLLSASERENCTIKEILNLPEHSFSEALDDRFIMFLGFDDNLLMKFIRSYPVNLKRPVFCGLTITNIDWKVNYLMEHLLEEKKRCENGLND
ncbi:MAG: DUF3783 domain-containing protein [Spirochaetes bacterium]|nr:DUF3783 domain-containing protein [Spirochaetota bacterium]